MCYINLSSANAEAFKIKVTESNCNYLISIVERQQNFIGKQIDVFSVLDNEISKSRTLILESRYNHLCNQMDILTQFRRTHRNCAIKGDKSYQPCCTGIGWFA